LKKNKISKNWINRQKKDIYVRQSKLEGFRSRAVYKLKEIDEKFKLTKSISTAIDLGAAPGSWSQYLSNKLKKGKILAIDILKIEPIKNIYFIQGDFTDEKYQNEIVNFFQNKVDLIVSDMAVNTTGNKNLDSIVTGDLCMNAMNFSLNHLSEKGVFLSKIFMGSSFNEIVATGKKSFKELKVFKPSSSRKESKESFIICKYLK
tara:strand:+ start:550 stop:1161 length:612 start_codon:yes stop_codon:yes gene_type:complete